MQNTMRLGLQQKLTQELRMTPEMQLAIKVLQLNVIELKNEVLEVLETNPVVELDEARETSKEIPLERVTQEGKDEAAVPSKDFSDDENRDDFGIDWQKYIQDSENTELRISGGSYAGEEETTFESFVSKKDNLRDHLTRQLQEASLNTTQKKIGEYIIGLIDRNGYLRLAKQEIAEILKVDTAMLDEVIRAIQAMDPHGVGAFDLRECLMIQALDEGYTNDAVTAIIADYLPDLAANKVGLIAKEIGYDLDEVQAAIEVIRSFNPKPGAAFPSTGEEIYVTPDVHITKEDDEYVISLNEKDIPRLRINSLYREAIKNKGQTEKATYEYIRGKLEAARSFLKFVDKRKETILNVTKAIVDVQKDFLDFGILHLKPLTLQDVAAVAGVHESTVSRATSGKYAQTPRGLFELKFFFSGAARTRSGEDISVQAVKKRVDNLVKQENPQKPLSDSDIVERLKDEGIFLARRTVAKYRTELNIPSSTARKRI